MALQSLSLTNFRSYKDQTIDLDPVVTLIVGPNATGKTNLLEALFVLSTTKSFRAKDNELIRHGESFYRISADKDESEIALGYEIGDRGTQKRVRHEGASKSLVDHLGTLRIVLFEPNDLLLINGAPERRRKYLDFILTQTDRQYVKTLHKYRRVLAQRNSLLSDWTGAKSEIFAWNVKLAELAADIDSRRRKLIKHINELAVELYEQISGSEEQLELDYRGAVEGNTEDYASAFLAALENNLSRDIGAGFTTIGPHRDDFVINFKGADIKTVASRGEMRTVVLALKMAEFAYIEQQTETKPILLLDDVFSELDDSRRHFLLNTLGGYQALITTTNADVSDEIGAHHATIYTEELQRAKR